MGERKTFTLNTSPHVAELGEGLELHFVPEVMGDEFLEGYVQLQEATRGIGGTGPDGTGGMDMEKAVAVIRDLRGFLFKLLMPESQEVFSRFVVVKGGREVSAHVQEDEAEAAAAGLKAATVRDESLKLPMRVLMELMEWVAQIYGGGARPTGSSTASSSPLPRGTRRGTATSASKG
ncbi:hypothetical protein [Streptomyces fuscigenes]|uniref:hypothetical protein n=1 Tax=Streptomyces fuscigenes TaxID=1528880 RepID=UPI001F1C52AA|nr:hypothetical protein [Streptomyces fuscigenes]MCF3960608.1 hypothetical protein [Streptomyces fuscigenes]